MAERKTAAKPATTKQPGKQATPPRDPQTLPIAGKQGETPAQAKARAATKASINSVMVVNAYQGNLLGKDVDIGELLTEMQDKFNKVNDGDLSSLEAMLVGQATALQTMFTSLAMRAADQEYLKQYGLYMTLALKAQAQSRATISALVDLKYPKQAATFCEAGQHCQRAATGEQWAGYGRGKFSKLAKRTIGASAWQLPGHRSAGRGRRR